MPPRFKKEPVLVLEIGLDLPVPIPDLKVDARGVSGTLSFDRPYPCRIPWEAIFGVFGPDKRGMSWPESFPAELLEKAHRQKQADERRAAFRTVGEEAEEDSAPEPKAERRSPRPVRGGGALAAVALAEDSSDDGFFDEDDSDDSDDASEASEPKPRPALSVVDGSGKKGPGKGSKKELPPYLRVIK